MPVATSENGKIHLFVYGSLMSLTPASMGARERHRLAGESRSLGPASTPGRLISLGPYPGLINATSDHEIVQGELLVLRNAQATLLWLDQYENVQRGEHGNGEYRRELRLVELGRGKITKTANRNDPIRQRNTYRAWVYVYQGSMIAAQAIPSGDWLKR